MVHVSQLEMFPISDFTQRWKYRKQSWKHPDQGGFDASLYDVAFIEDDKTARDFVVSHHYSGTCPVMVYRVGMYEQGVLVGIALFSIPTQEKVLTKPFPSLLPYKESLELGRFLLLDHVPANGETWFLKRAFELVRKEGIAGIVSFSDPIPRSDASGNIIFPGHVGHIYKCKGAIYTGRSNPRTLFLLPDGTVLSERTIQKIRKQERGHRSAEERLREMGAPEIGPEEIPSQWLHRALPAAGVRTMKHSGNYRYVFTLHKRVYMPLASLPYPTHSAIVNSIAEVVA